MSKFGISPSLGCQYPDNILGMTLDDPGKHCEYIRFSLSISRSDSCLWSLIFVRVSYGCSFGVGLRAFWIHHISVVLYPMDRRHSLSSSVSSTILIQIDTSSA